MLKKIISLSLISSTLLLAESDIPDFFDFKKEQTVKSSMAQDASEIKNEKANFVTEEESKRLEEKTQATDKASPNLDTQVAEQILLKEMKDKKAFNLKPKSLFVDKKVKFVEIKIPVQQISEVFFDKQIVKIDLIENPKLTVELDQQEGKKIKFINKDLNLDSNMKITFIDGSTINLLLNLGNAINERHIEYKLYFEKKEIALLPEFQQKLKIKNIHTYFNNVATKLISDKIMKSNDFINIEENKKKINEVLFEGKTTMDSIYGNTEQEFKLVLDYVYETPYVEDTQKENIKKRLVMLEMTITNKEAEKILLVSPEFLKKRFGNYVAMYMGDLDSKQNHVAPNDTLKLLVVIEDSIEDKDN